MPQSFLADQRASSTQIDYGTTTAYGNTTTLNASLVTAHSQAVSQLSAATLYHYRVRSTDAAGNTAVSGDNTFYHCIRSRCHASRATVCFGAGSQSDIRNHCPVNQRSVNHAGSLRHHHELRFHQSAQRIAGHCAHRAACRPSVRTRSITIRSFSTDAAGNTATSSDQTFTTQSAPVITGVSAGTLTPAAATISWTTSLLSTSQVEYGTTTSYGAQTALDASLSSPFTLCRFAGRRIHVVPLSRALEDANGNETVGTDNTFTTPAAADIHRRLSVL